MVQATVCLILAEGHYPRFSPESDHNTSPHQPPRAQNWCQAARKDLQGPCSLAQNDPMAWNGLETTLHHAPFTRINQTLTSPNNVKGEIQLFRSLCDRCDRLAPLKSMSACTHLWNSNLQISKSANPEGSAWISMSIGWYCEVSIYIILRKDRDFLWCQSCWRPQEP